MFNTGDLVRVQVDRTPVEGYEDLSYDTMIWGIIVSKSMSGKYFVEFARSTDTEKYYSQNPFPADVIRKRGN